MDTIYEAPASAAEVESKDPCVIHPRVKKIIDQIFDLKAMERTLKSLEIDLKKLPLGRLTKQRIMDGFSALDTISKLITTIWSKQNPEEAAKREETRLKREKKDAGDDDEEDEEDEEDEDDEEEEDEEESEDGDDDNEEAKKAREERRAAKAEAREKKRLEKEAKSAMLIDVTRLDRQDKSSLLSANDKFYTLIPHELDRGTNPHVDPASHPWVLKSTQQIKEKSEMLQSMLDMVETMSIVNNASASQNQESKMIDSEHATFEERLAASNHPSDCRYRGLKNKIVPVEKDSEEWKMISNYLKKTHGATHSSYKLQLLDAFVVEREGEKERFERYCVETFGSVTTSTTTTTGKKKAAPKKGRGKKAVAAAEVEDDNAMKDGETEQKITLTPEIAAAAGRELLWHGSRLTNFGGILSQGTLTICYFIFTVLHFVTTGNIVLVVANHFIVYLIYPFLLALFYLYS